MSIYFYELVLLFFIFHHNFCKGNIDNFFKGYVMRNNFSRKKSLNYDNLFIMMSIFSIYHTQMFYLVQIVVITYILLSQIFITSENNSVFLIITFIIFRSFSRKQNKCLRLCYLSVFWFSIVSLKFQINDGFCFNFSLLQKCPKNDFFNLETLISCRHIQHITSHKIFGFF